MSNFWAQFGAAPPPPPKPAHDYSITSEQAERLAGDGFKILAILSQEPAVIVRMAMTLQEVRNFFGDQTILEVIDVESTEL